jgi:exopolysaccharide biosynthesis polyprenyl glycosylphosphotransferase
MSVDERNVTGLDAADRRRETSSRRHSWASPQPFTLPDIDDAEASAVQLRRAARRRGVWERPLQITALIGDVVIATVAVSVTALVSLHDGHDVIATAALAGMLWVSMVAAFGGYQVRRMGSGPEEFQAILRAGLAVTAVMVMTAYTTHVTLPRRWVFITMPVIGIACGIWRLIARKSLHRRRRTGQAMLRTLVVGSPGRVAPVIGDLSHETHHGYLVVGACTPYLDLDAESSIGVETLGTLSDIPQVVVDHEIDVVIVTGSELAGSALRRLSWALEHAGAQLVVAPGLVEVAGPHVSLRPAAGLSLVHLEIPSQHMARGLGKAVLDRCLGAGLLLAASPVIGAAALAVKINDPGPAFFAQTRAGVDGQPFTMWKLRSMVVDAEKIREQLLDRNEGAGLLFKMADDPRVTPVGRFIRRYSIDELPQLWNVVRGDMSLVGPRPPLMSEYEQYHDAVNRRLRVKPGCTGLWQVSGRSNLSWDQSVNLDLRYVDNWSLAMDLLILWKTLRVVLRGSGAY